MSRRTEAAVKAWLMNPAKPLALVGPTGPPKARLLTRLGSEVGMTAETHEDALQALSTARNPTFDGGSRFALIEDVDWLTKREWSRIEKALPHAPPVAFIAQSLRSLPYQVRRQCAVIEVSGPSVRQDEMNHTWGIEPDLDHQPWLDERDQPAAILSGGYRQSSVHPLSVIGMALHNHGDPDQALRALMLHSTAWDHDGLSAVARCYVETLRTERQDPTPYRKR